MNFNSPDVLYRFSNKQYLIDFVNKGMVSFNHAKNFKSQDLTPGQYDDEYLKKVVPDLRNRIITINNQTMHHVKRVEVNQELDRTTDIYILSCSLEYNKELYSEFNADACVRILNPEMFSNILYNRLSDEYKLKAPQLALSTGGVSYFESNDFIPLYLKETSYMHQKEYRFAIIDVSNKIKQERFEIELGSLRKICELVN